MGASACLEDTDAISKTQITDSTTTLTGDQGQDNATQSTENCSGNKSKCNSLQNGHIRSKRQSGDGTVIEVPPNASTATETESRVSRDETSKTHTSVVRNRKAVSKMTFAPALDCEQIVLQHFLPPPAPEPPPYVQPPPHPLANTSSTITPPSPCATWASARNQSTGPTIAQETPRQIHPACANTFMPKAVQVSSQRSSRPCSAGHGNLFKRSKDC